MADVLEAMGFPSDWCERALSSASGIETAVDLLLQWQAQGTPQFTSPPVGPSSPGRNVAPQGGPSSSRPTLKLLPIPTSDSKGMATDCEASPSSTLQRSSSSSGPSSPSGLSGLDESRALKSPVVPPGDVTCGSTGVGSSVFRGRNLTSSQEPLDRMTTTNISCVDDDCGGSGRGAGTSRVANNPESSDAVVPDAFAEERKSRYAAAQRAKQEKEAEKAKIRQQLQEDKAQRRFRHTMMAPSNSPNVKIGKQPVGPSMPTGLAADSAVPTHLQIRCPGNQIIKGSFTAGTSLKEVRAYVECHLQRLHLSLDHQEHSSGFRPSLPFSGSSSRLSSDRQAERIILQAARDNFEAQTSRILASAKTLRQQQHDPMGANRVNQAKGIIYFLIPVPRQEFFTESAMESTLAQAQLVPRGTLIVQYRNADTEETNASAVQASSTQVEESNKADDTVGQSKATEACQNSVEAVGPELKEHESAESKYGDAQMKKPSQSKKISNSFERGLNGASNSGRNSLDVDGERVRVRELALQAAAKRMSEAARIFREGIPLGEGETGGAFPFPNDGDHPYAYHTARTQNGYTPPQQSAPTVLADNIIPTNLTSAGADAELLDASPHARERSSGFPGPDKPYDRTLDAVHRQAMAAAEARLKSSQGQAILVGCSHELEPEEAESRIGVEGSDSPPQRGRARVPPSSRLLSRPEKLQRTSDNPPSCSPAACEGCNNPEELPDGSAKAQSQTASPSYAGPFEAALERFSVHTEWDTKGKEAVVEDDGSSRMTTIPSSHQAQVERQIALRVRFEDGHVQTLSFPANTLLQYVRDSVVPEGADASAYGFFINVPEPHYVEGDDLGVTLEDAGLASREIVHLLRMSSRGMVRQGRRPQYRRRLYVPSDDEAYNVMGMLPHLVDPHDRQDLTYEELMELEESIGRVHVGVPEEVIAALPTHNVKNKRTQDVTKGDNHEDDVDVCIICMAEMMDGEEALTLPCVHNFHPLCIRRWLQQSTCCPTCKNGLI